MIIKIPQPVIAKAKILLPMEYSISEISEELNVSLSTVRDWVSKSQLSRQDNHGHIWVNGNQFGQWLVTRTNPKKPKFPMCDDQAYCLNCACVVNIQNPSTTPVNGKLLHIIGVCPFCGGAVYRGGRNEKSN